MYGMVTHFAGMSKIEMNNEKKMQQQYLLSAG